MICPDTPRRACQEHDTQWHVTFPDTSRSDPRFAECRGIPRSPKFHEIAHFTQWICSTGVLVFHTFKLALCIHNKLRSHAEILSWWAFDVTFPGSNPLRSNRSGLNVSNGDSWNPKFTFKVNSFWIKIKGQNFASQVLSRHTFKISRKKGSDYFDHRGTLRKCCLMKQCSDFFGEVPGGPNVCIRFRCGKRLKNYNRPFNSNLTPRPRRKKELNS